MKANVGDRIEIGTHKVGQPVRCGHITEVRGAGGAPPYMVRWDTDASQGLVFPGADAVIRPEDSPARPGADR